MEVSFDHINKSYGRVKAVHDVSLRISAGALHFLLGPSGCGKTTLLRMLAGLEAPTSGRILFDGKDLTDKPAAARGIGMVFQNYALWPHMTVRKNIEYGLTLQKLPRDRLQSRVEEVIQIAQLSAFTERLPGQLSGGQQQRVALARALAVRPSVLLLDEPLSNLDAQLRLEMRDSISRIHQQLKITTVYVTHDQKEALSMGTEVTVLRDGRVVQTEAPRRLYHAPTTAFVARFVGETNLIHGVYQGREDGHHVVKTGFGLFFAARSSFEPRPGQSVNLSVRPEAVRIYLDGVTRPHVNPLRATLMHLTYLGEMEQMQLRFSDLTSLKASVFNPPEHQMRAGDVVLGSIEPEHLLVLPAEAEYAADI